MNNAEKLLWVILIAVHGLFFVYQINIKPAYLTDSEDYLIAADNVRNYAIYYYQLLTDPISTEAYTRRPPLYPLIILIIKSIWNSDSGVLLFQNFLSLLNFGLLFRFFQKHFALAYKKSAYLIPFVVFYPAQPIYANLVMAEIVLQTFLLLFFISTYEFIKTKQNRYFFLAAAWLITGIFTKPVLVYFSRIFALGSLFYAIKIKRKGLIVLGTLPLLAILSYNSWNFHRTGYFHFSSIKEINLLYYNTALFLQKNYGLAYSDSVITTIEQKASFQTDFATKQTYISTESNKILLSDIFKYGIFHGKGMINFFLDPGRFDLYTFFRLQTQDQAGLLHYFSSQGYSGIYTYLKEQPVSLVFFLLFTALLNIIKLIAFGWFIFNRNFNTELRILMAVVVIYFAFITGPLGASRFYVPVFPIMLLAIPGFFNWLKTKSLRIK